MTIASEITKLQTNLSDCYTSCVNKNAVIPASQNFDNLSATIDSIKTGDFYATLKVITNEEATVTIDGETQIAYGGIALFYLYQSKQYTITCEKDGYTKDGVLNITEAIEYEISIYPKSDTPDNYQRVEYIQSNGTGYIDTGFAFTSNTAKISIEVMLTQSTPSRNLFGSSTNYDNNWFGIYMQSGTQGGLYCGSGNPWTYNFSINNKRSLVFDKQGNTLYVTNNGSTSTYPVSGTIICGNDVMIASQPPMGASRSPYGVRYYSFGIEQDGIEVRRYIPVYRKADNVIGMYDELNNIFYPPDAGTFVKGPDV